MSTKTHTYATIICDGCEAVYGAPGQHGNVQEARQGALASGWTLVPKKTAKGRSARVSTGDKSGGATTRSANDVCPACIDSFQPTKYEGGGGFQTGQIWWKERMDQQDAEIQRLKNQLRAAGELVI